MGITALKRYSVRIRSDTGKRSIRLPFDWQEMPGHRLLDPWLANPMAVQTSASLYQFSLSHSHPACSTYLLSFSPLWRRRTMFQEWRKRHMPTGLEPAKWVRRQDDDSGSHYSYAWSCGICDSRNIGYVGGRTAWQMCAMISSWVLTNTWDGLNILKVPTGIHRQNIASWGLFRSWRTCMICPTPFGTM